jgi:ABC-type oligopeptide transport system substrate-binding subunit
MKKISIILVLALCAVSLTLSSCSKNSSYTCVCDSKDYPMSTDTKALAEAECAAKSVVLGEDCEIE